MQTSPRRVLLNRPVFTQKEFSSDSLTVLTTLLHRFTEPGSYQVRVKHARRPELAFAVEVSPTAGKQQLNVDLAGLIEDDAGCCGEDDRYELVAGGVLGLYPSAGVGGYAVTISHLGEKEKSVVLDNRKGVPGGDFFVVTLTRPGVYRVGDENSKAETEVHVGLPKGERVRTDAPTLLQLGREGFEGEAPRLIAGQSLVIHCETTARLRVVLTRDDTEVASEDGKGKAGAKATAAGRRRTVHKRPARDRPIAKRPSTKRKSKK